MLSLRRATATASKPAKQTVDFYPCSPCGERHGPILTITYLTLFLSMLSLRRATACLPACVVGAPISIHALLAESDIGPLIFSVQPRNFYPCSPCGERLPSTTRRLTNLMISIHALLAESDRKYHTADRVRAYISIHALLAESDLLL